MNGYVRVSMNVCPYLNLMFSAVGLSVRSFLEKRSGDRNERTKQNAAPQTTHVPNPRTLENPPLFRYLFFIICHRHLISAAAASICLLVRSYGCVAHSKLAVTDACQPPLLTVYSAKCAFVTATATFLWYGTPLAPSPQSLHHTRGALAAWFASCPSIG